MEGDARHVGLVAAVIGAPLLLDALTCTVGVVHDHFTLEPEVPIRVLSGRVQRIPDRDAVTVDRVLKVDSGKSERPLPLIPFRFTSDDGSDQQPVIVILVGDPLGRLPPGEPAMGDAKLRRRSYFPAELLVAGEPFTSWLTNI